jgi:uncharacterized protein (TIGR02145 family)
MKEKFYVILMTLSIVLIVSCKKTNDEIQIKDKDGNVYTSVIIGTQEWMVENLKVTKYNDGSDIAYIDDPDAWNSATSAAYSWYDNNSAANKNVYGALYNLYAVRTGKLCPAGWHVPSNEEWTTLSDQLGGYNLAGNALKEKGLAHWSSYNIDATNSSGFTGLPGGCRYSEGFRSKGLFGCWWTTRINPGTHGSYFTVANLSGTVYIGTFSPNFGVSVRCLKD